MALSTLRCASASALAVVLQSERSAYAAGAAGDAHLSRNGDGGICLVSTRQPVSVRVGNRSGKELWSLVDGRRGKKKSVTRAVAVVSGSGSLEMAAALFTFATAFVMPMYTVMIVAPKWEWTKKAVESSLPFAVLGALYMYLFALSWTPETMQLMFASKYWLPELAGITRMFSSTTTVASAWVHLLAADLFAGRQVFLDGLKNDVETRHSLVLCLMMCPIGILCHIVTKFVTLFLRRKDQGRQEAFNVR